MVCPSEISRLYPYNVRQHLSQCEVLRLHRSLALRLLIVMLAIVPLLYGSNGAFAASSVKRVTGDTDFWAFSCSTATRDYAASSAAASNAGGFTFAVKHVDSTRISGTWSIIFPNGQVIASGSITGGTVSGSSFMFTGIETANTSPESCGTPPIQVTLSGKCGDNVVFKLAGSTDQSVQTAAGTGTVQCL
jgi:hypothetical protein